MKSKSMLAAVAPILVFGFAISSVSLSANAYAQDNPNVEEELTQQLEEAGEVVQEASEAVEETIEEVAEHVAEVGEEFSEALEKWMGQHGGELEKWSEEHGDQWNKWAERLEQRVEKWSATQEKQWTSWAEHYEKEMGDLSKQFENEDLTSDDVSNLIETNLRLLGEIPIGEMIQQGIRAGANELESAPWKSLDDLSRIAGDAASDSVEAAEKLTGSAMSRAARTSFNHAGALKKAHGQLAREFERQQIELKQLFERRIEALEGVIEEGGESAEAARKMIDRLIEVRDEKSDQLERQHKLRKEQLEAVSQQKADAANQAPQAEQDEAPSKDELQTLRREIELLRQEVQRLKK